MIVPVIVGSVDKFTEDDDPVMGDDNITVKSDVT